LSCSFDANSSFFEINKNFHEIPHFENWDFQTSGFIASDALIRDSPPLGITTEHRGFFPHSWDISTTQFDKNTPSWPDEFGRRISLSKSSEGRALDYLSPCQPSAITQESLCIATNFPSSTPLLDTSFSLTLGFSLDQDLATLLDDNLLCQTTGSSVNSSSLMLSPSPSSPISKQSDTLPCTWPSCEKSFSKRSDYK